MESSAGAIESLLLQSPCYFLDCFHALPKSSLCSFLRTHSRLSWVSPRPTVLFDFAKFFRLFRLSFSSISRKFIVLRSFHYFFSKFRNWELREQNIMALGYNLQRQRFSYETFCAEKFCAFALSDSLIIEDAAPQIKFSLLRL